MHPNPLKHLLVILLVSVCSIHHSQAFDVEPASGNWQLIPSESCGGDRRCSFSDRSGRNVYEIKDGCLSRTEDGESVFSFKLTDQSDHVVLSDISGQRNQLVVVIERAIMSLRSRSTLHSVHPSDMQRQYRFELLNPKSGQRSKSIPLGALWPTDAALSDGGDYLLVFGEDLESRATEIHLYNTRAGTRELVHPVSKKARVKLGRNGFVVDGVPWEIRSERTNDRVRREVTRRFGSIAEYKIKCPSTLRLSEFENRALAVVEIADADYITNQMLSNGLTVELQGAGFTLVERQRIQEILEELSLQGSGLTSEDKAVEIGELANAQFLVFGSLQAVGPVSTLSFRVVGVEDGRVASAAEVECQDCEESDYYEALSFLVATWVGD